MPDVLVYIEVELELPEGEGCVYRARQRCLLPGTKGVFGWGKNLDFGTVEHFVVT